MVRVGYASTSHPFQIKWAEYVLSIAEAKKDTVVHAGDYAFIEGHKYLSFITKTVKQTDCSTSADIDDPGEADFYVKVKLGGREILEATNEDDDDIAPAWRTMIPSG